MSDHMQALVPQVKKKKVYAEVNVADDACALKKSASRNSKKFDGLLKHDTAITDSPCNAIKVPALTTQERKVHVAVQIQGVYHISTLLSTFSADVFVVLHWEERDSIRAALEVAESRSRTEGAHVLNEYWSQLDVFLPIPEFGKMCATMQIIIVVVYRKRKGYQIQRFPRKQCAKICQVGRPSTSVCPIGYSCQRDFSDSLQPVSYKDRSIARPVWVSRWNITLFIPF